MDKADFIKTYYKPKTAIGEEMRNLMITISQKQAGKNFTYVGLVVDDSVKDWEDV